jgi:hypothetical protein
MSRHLGHVAAPRSNQRPNCRPLTVHNPAAAHEILKILQPLARAKTIPHVAPRDKAAEIAPVGGRDTRGYADDQAVIQHALKVVPVGSGLG